MSALKVRIRQIVDEAPPLTREQLIKLARTLGSAPPQLDQLHTPRKQVA